MKRNRFTLEQIIRLLREGLRFACRRQERDENNQEPRASGFEPPILHGKFQSKGKKSGTISLGYVVTAFQWICCQSVRNAAHIMRSSGAISDAMAFMILDAPPTWPLL